MTWLCTDKCKVWRRQNLDLCLRGVWIQQGCCIDGTLCLHLQVRGVTLSCVISATLMWCLTTCALYKVGLGVAASHVLGCGTVCTAATFWELSHGCASCWCRT